jgi:hypothetical protein
VGLKKNKIIITALTALLSFPRCDITGTFPNDMQNIVDASTTDAFPNVGESVVVYGKDTKEMVSIGCCPVIKREPSRFLLGYPCNFWIGEDGTFLIYSCINGRTEIR